MTGVNRKPGVYARILFVNASAYACSARREDRERAEVHEWVRAWESLLGKRCHCGWGRLVPLL